MVIPGIGIQANLADEAKKKAGIPVWKFAARERRPKPGWRTFTDSPRSHASSPRPPRPVSQPHRRLACLRYDLPVIVDGRVLRRAGSFTAADHGKIVAEAREAATELRDKAKWPG